MINIVIPVIEKMQTMYLFYSKNIQVEILKETSLMRKYERK